MSDRITEHPDDLLAEYVEGALGTEGRARVEAHLPACDRCREEVALATEARAALATVPEAAPPPGLELAVRRRSRGPTRRVWIAAGAAAAAAAVLLGAIVVLGSLGEQQGAPGAAGPPGAPQEERGASPTNGQELQAAGADLTVRRTGRDYTPTTLAALGRRLRDQASTTLATRTDRTSEEFYAGFEFESLSPEVRRTVNCVFREVPPEQLLVPYSIQEASFQGEPAYVAAFLQGPSPDTPFDRVLIWVVDLKTCSLRYYAAHQL
jgi:putative zinc finger protein